LSEPGTPTAPKAAEPSVRAANAAVLDALPFADRQDFDDAARGFVGSIPDAIIKDGAGRPSWSMGNYSFIDREQAPDTVNPSLWRMARLNCHHGLFRVVDGIYQIRGFDIANMTIVEGATGIIIIDTLTTADTARAALDLYFQHRPRRPVAAVIYTHTHVDHWGGVKGVIDPADVASGKVSVIAPDGFMEHAISENVIAGTAMVRRAHYQFGTLLLPGERGQVDAGLGKTIARGTVTLIAPTDLVRQTGERRVIDGVEIVFQMAPNSEAPAEFHLYLPAFRALNLAENATHLFHNLLPFRGAEVRDPLAWSCYLGEALELFAERADVLIVQHHWPVWGRERIVAYLKAQRDLYKYVHDQTLRLMNHGHTAAEIAEQITLPKSLATQWQNRDYYGTVRHNVKAIYQRYLGWYDAVPAHLDPLPSVAGASKYLDYMGGANAVIARARADFAAGHYRWVAEVMNHVVFAAPDNRAARELLADAYEQLGYAAEAATWRNAYLFGAYELRNGVARQRSATPVAPDALRSLTIPMLLDYIAVRLNGPNAEGKRIVINFSFTDTEETYALTLENATLTYVAGKQAADADATLTLTRAALDTVMLRQTTFIAAMQGGAITVDGNPAKLLELWSLLDEFQPMFDIVTP
jgi:alkyl sulfatase BDS1-like metallo-beta-lactamase superfamily hydrolase